MQTTSPVEVYRQFQSYLVNGQFDRLGEVADMERYTENCVGLTGWTTGLPIALRNFQEGVASRLTDMVATEHDVLETEDTLVLRGSMAVTHSGEFMGVPPTGRRATYDFVDMFRLTDGRITWRYLLCDWKGLLDQLTAP
jgi:predicted ester cyclase